MLSKTTMHKTATIALMLSLIGCAAATVTLAGCNAFQEEWLSFPYDAAREAPVELLQWLERLQIRMQAVCE